MYQLDIDLKKYPELKKQKKSELDKSVKKIFDLGYKMKYPKIEKNREIVSNIRDGIQIDELNRSITQLLGVTSNSSKKGELVEGIVEEYVKARYGEKSYEVKRSEGHCGDGWLKLSNGIKCVVEVKAYLTTVNAKELEKLKYDMDYNDMRYGIMVSLGSNIQGSKLLDLETYERKGVKNYVIKLSHVSENYDMLDMGFNLLEKISEIDNSKKSVYYLEDKLREKIEILGDKINRSKKIREMYSNMSKEIGDRMSEFYVELTNMYLEQENILREISSEISSNSVKKLLIDDNELKKVEKFNSYKIYVNLIKVVDMLVRLGVGYKIDGNKMLSEKFEMKIGKEKLSINLFDIDVVIKLDVKKENKNNLELLEKLLK